jgi:cytidylate kinase
MDPGIMEEKLLIVIDGPAGAGKTTVSRGLAKRLNYRYIDTGALYRGVAYAAQAAGIDGSDERVLDALCRNMDMNFRRADTGVRLWLNGKDITDGIRSPEITMLASAISARPAVRAYLLDLQRKLGAEKAAVFEGRDMGTVVFPNADVKFFLTASCRERAMRRYKEMHPKTQTREEVEKDIRTRDKNDSTRKLAPLKQAGDAIKIDSTGIPAEAVVDLMIRRIFEKIKSQNQKG